MGRVYCGPYAEQVGYEHEGYAARVLPGGEVTATWTAATAEFTAHVAACACGWTGGRHAPSDEGEEFALGEWDRVHLQPLIARAEREGWRAWAVRTANAASTIGSHLAQGRPEAAVPLMCRLVVDVQAWALVLADVAEGRGADAGGGR